jgi:hypothetical protein
MGLKDDLKNIQPWSNDDEVDYGKYRGFKFGSVDESYWLFNYPKMKRTVLWIEQRYAWAEEVAKRFFPIIEPELVVENTGNGEIDFDAFSQKEKPLNERYPGEITLMEDDEFEYVVLKVKKDTVLKSTPVAAALGCSSGTLIGKFVGKLDLPLAKERKGKESYYFKPLSVVTWLFGRL